MIDQAHSGYQLPDGFQRESVDADGLQLNYWRRGSGPPLLVLHGVTDWGLDWARFARRAEGQLDCVLLDQRGHGFSDKPGRGYGYADFARDACHLIRALDLDRPAVLGHSMGGGAALALAATFPDVVGRLLLVDPAIRIGDQERADEAAQRESRAKRRTGLIERQRQGYTALRDSLLSSHPNWDREDIENTAQSTMLVSPSVWSDERWFDLEAQESQLRSLTCPTLIVRGEPERGAIITDSAKQRIEELVPNSLVRVTTIAGTGHVPQREAFELFVAVVLPFLTEQSAPDAEGGSPACLLHLVEDE